MSKGNTILLSGNPKGVFLEGEISGTPKPGTLMQVKAAALKNGEPVWEAVGATTPLGADGAPALIAVLLEDAEQGFPVTQAFVSGTRGRLYSPAPGEDMNVLAGEAAGTTGNNFAVGDRLMLDTDSGNLIPASGSPASVPFISMETATAVTEPYLLFCRATGH